jgi:hypothetical protein
MASSDRRLPGECTPLYTDSTASEVLPQTDEP